MFVSFFPFLRNVNKKYFQMKKSILVAVCSLAGVCASSAQAGVYTLTTYKFFSPAETAAQTVQSITANAHSDIDTDRLGPPLPNGGMDIGLFLASWGGAFVAQPSTPPSWYYVQIFYANASAISNGSNLVFSNNYDDIIVSASSAGSQYSLSSFAQNSPSTFTTTFQDTRSEFWFAFITTSASAQTGGVNAFTLYSPENALLGASTADLSAATEFTPVISTFSAVPAPGAVALLGLAGVFGARRRRN